MATLPPGAALPYEPHQKTTRPTHAPVRHPHRRARVAGELLLLLALTATMTITVLVGAFVALLHGIG